MEIKLSIEYYTSYGEAVFVDIAGYELYPMKQRGCGVWECTIKHESREPLHYSYAIKKDGITVRKECGSDRIIINTGCNNVTNYDKWHDFTEESYTGTTPFRIIFERPYHENIKSVGSLTFTLLAPLLPKDITVAVTGNFTNWSLKEPLRLKPQRYPFWEGSIPLEGLPENIEYKYILLDEETKAFYSWEEGENREFKIPEYKPDENINITGDNLTFIFPAWRSAGVVIPLFSLRSSRSWGIGDTSDLMSISLWAKKVGMRFIQLLPINDTTNLRDWQDLYPYSANSSLALHPAYLDVVKAGKLKSRENMHIYLTEAEELNKSQILEYEKVAALKERYLRELYAEIGDHLQESEEFSLFMEQNSSWLIPYAVYSYLRDFYGANNFSKWGEYTSYNQEKISHLLKRGSTSYKEVGYYYFIQFLLHKQFGEAIDYAHSIGVMFKGDIPIGVNRYSADVWQNPELFDCQSQAGAPPDDFASDGQNWGFPTYRWDIMSQDGYTWWRSRLQNMARYFDAYRIDHILGFFRIWSIPSDSISGLLGYFVPAIPLSPQELESSGFNFNPTRDTSPHITENIIDEVFGKYSEKAKGMLFTEDSKGHYSVKSIYSSQKKALNNIKGGTEVDIIKNGIISILTDVLFIEDKQKSGYYHPRIQAFKNNSYKALSQQQKEVFDRIYNDFYFHRHNNFWRDEAMTKLPVLISATDMLVCGEDLGMIPASVPYVMEKLQILSLEVEKMPKNDNVIIANTQSYPYLSVCTTSTHDMSGLRLWWMENNSITQHYYNDILGRSGKAPSEATPEICNQIISRHLDSPSMLAILPLQDIMAIDKVVRRHDPSEERINNLLSDINSWRYRMHITIEELTSNFDFMNNISKLIKDSGRS